MLWEEIIERAEKMWIGRNNVFQEEMQKVVLTALSQKGCFNSIVFQGGTALRLFYGNPRFSEVIDLVLKEGENEFDLSGFIPNIERFGHNSFPFLESVMIKTQKNEPGLQSYILQTQSENPEQKLRVHIELADVPSYRNSPRILDFPPILPAVRVEDAMEILADKVCALAFRPYLKGRDLWDIYFLTKERSVGLQWELVEIKVKDYKEPASELTDRLQKAKQRIQEDGMSILENELERFLPKNVLEQYRPSFDPILVSVVELISRPDNYRGI